MRATLGLVLILFLLGCEKKLDIDEINYPATLTMVVYDEKYALAQEKAIGIDNQLYLAVKSCLFDSKMEWKKSIVSYAPGILLYSDKLKINIQNKRKLIVVNYMSRDGQWTQVAGTLPLPLLEVLSAQ